MLEAMAAAVQLQFLHVGNASMSHCSMAYQRRRLIALLSLPQAGAPCSKACKCENCQNQALPGAQPPDPPEAVATVAAGRRAAPGPPRGGGAKAPSFTSPGTPSLQ
jgi:hypothetical protein